MDEMSVASDIAPQEITHLVRIKLANAFDQRAVKNELRRFRRPFLPSAFGQFTLGARNEHDATKLAPAVERLASIRSAVPIRLNRFRQWLIRQRLAGNYAGESGDWFYYPGDGYEDGWADSTGTDVQLADPSLVPGMPRVSIPADLWRDCAPVKSSAQSGSATALDERDGAGRAPLPIERRRVPLSDVEFGRDRR